MNQTIISLIAVGITLDVILPLYYINEQNELESGCAEINEFMKSNLEKTPSNFDMLVKQWIANECWK